MSTDQRSIRSSNWFKSFSMDIQNQSLSHHFSLRSSFSIQPTNLLVLLQLLITIIIIRIIIIHFQQRISYCSHNFRRIIKSRYSPIKWSSMKPEWIFLEPICASPFPNHTQILRIYLSRWWVVAPFYTDIELPSGGAQALPVPR